MSLQTKNWRAFRQRMLAAGWVQQGSGGLCYFTHPDGGKFMPLRYDTQHQCAAWVAYTDTTPSTTITPLGHVGPMACEKEQDQ